MKHAFSFTRPNKDEHYFGQFSCIQNRKFMTKLLVGPMQFGSIILRETATARCAVVE